MTFEEFNKIPFHSCSHISMTDLHITIYVSDDGRFSYSSYVRFRDGQPYGRSIRHYCIGMKVFKTKKKFIEALAEIN